MRGERGAMGCVEGPMVGDPGVTNEGVSGFWFESGGMPPLSVADGSKPAYDAAWGVDRVSAGRAEIPREVITRGSWVTEDE